MEIFIGPILISLQIASMATLLAFVFGTVCAVVMVRTSLPGKEIIETIFTLPMVLPPTVVGFGLLFLFGKNGPLGKLLATMFDFQLVFTVWGAVIAAMVVAFPLVYLNVRAGLESVDINQERAARTLGASELKVFFTITLPLAWPGLLTGIILAFTRSLGEFGATLMVAGAIPGQTLTIAVTNNDMSQATPLVACVTIFSFVLLLCYNWWLRKVKAIRR
jgi:molybdate transport system permease protein